MRILSNRDRVSIKRRSVASVLAFMFLFAALYTAGVGFFVYVNSEVQSLGQANATLSRVAQQAGLEKLGVAAHLNSTGNLFLSINNTGGVATSILDVYVACNSKCGAALPGQIISNDPVTKFQYLTSSAALNVTLPITLPIGTSTKHLKSCGGGATGCDIGIKKGAFTFNQRTGETVVASVLTLNGNVFSAQYPPPPLPSSVNTVVSNESTISQIQESGGGPLIAMQIVASPPQTYSCLGCVNATAFVYNYANVTMTGVTVALNLPSVTGTAALSIFSPCQPSPQTILANSVGVFRCEYTAVTGAVGGFGSFSGTASGMLFGSPVTSAETNSNPIQIGGLSNVPGQGAFTGDFFLLKYSSCLQNLTGNYNFFSNGQDATLVIGQSSFTATSPPYVPITLTNSQSSPTPVPFQQMITFNPSTFASLERSDLGNIRFCADAACTLPLYAWIESCTPSCGTSATSATVWVRLTSAIPASGTQTIYMDFVSTAVGFDGVYWGEAPTISGTYGQYDNGANVFTIYDNFAGTTLSANWVTQASAGGSITVNNGITFKVASASDYTWIHTPSTYAYPLTDEANVLSQSGSAYITVADSLATTINGIYGEPYNGYDYDWYGGYVELDYNTATNSLSSSYKVTGFNAGIWSFSWWATGHQAGTNGVNPLTDTNSGTPIGNYYPYLGIGKYAASNFVAQWYRARATPPNNVAPGASLGSLVNPAASQKGESAPVAVAFDQSGNLWVADYGNNRVLEYGSQYSYSTGEPALLVIGQRNFTVGTPNTGGINATTLDGPTAVAFDASGNLWVADMNNNRILEFTHPFSTNETASLVIGQVDFTHGLKNQGGAVNSVTVSNPRGLAFDSAGNLWVADWGNNRILEYPKNFTTREAATTVLGQKNMGQGNPNQGGAEAANTLNGPWGLAFDALGNLWATDNGNNRVLEYVPAFSNNEAASLVLGQSSFTGGTANSGGLGSASLNGPTGVTFDPASNLYVVDSNNNRVLEYLLPFTNDEAAWAVVGQPDFAHNTAATTQTGLSTAGGGGVATDVFGNLWVADTNNNRVLMFTKALSDFQGSCSANASPVTLSKLPSGSIVGAGSSFYGAYYVQVTNGFNTTLPILQYSYLFGDASIAGEDFWYLVGSNTSLSNGVYYPNYGATPPSLLAYPSDCNIVNAQNVPTDPNCYYVSPGKTATLTYAAAGWGSSIWGWGGHKDADGYDNQTLALGPNGAVGYSPCFVYDSNAGGAVRGDCRSPIGGLPTGVFMGIVVSYLYKGRVLSQVLPFEGQTLLRGTTTSFGCNPSSVGSGIPTTCTAHVIDSDGGRPIVPTGNVTFTASPPTSGFFSPSANCVLTAGGASCLLNPSGSTSVQFTPTISQGNVTINATYTGDVSHSGSGPSSQNVAVVALVTTTVTTTQTTTLTTTVTTTSSTTTITTTTTTASTQTSTSTVTSTGTHTSTTTTTTSGTATIPITTVQTSTTTHTTSHTTTATSTSTTTLTTSVTITTTSTVSTTTLSTTLTTTVTTTSTIDTTRSTSTTTSTTATYTSTSTVVSTTTTTTTTTRPH